MQNILKRIGAAQMAMGFAMVLVVGVLSFATNVSSAEAVVQYRLPFSSNQTISAWYDHDSSWNELRYDGDTNWNYPATVHYGTDFAASYGTTIYAGADGDVYSRTDGCADSNSGGCGYGYGNNIRLEHTDNRVTIYAHMKNGSPTWLGSVICDYGATVGQVASSGDSTGNHLHFELRESQYGSKTDPFSGDESQAQSYWVSQDYYSYGRPGPICQ